MALGTGTKVIDGTTVKVGQARRSVLGAPGLVAQGLTVVLRSPGGYRSNTKTVPAHPSRVRTDTIVRRPVLKVQRQNPVKRAGSSASSLRLKPRGIIPAAGSLRPQSVTPPAQQHRGIHDNLGVADSTTRESA